MRFAGVNFLGLCFALGATGAAANEDAKGLPDTWKLADNGLKLLQGAWKVHAYESLGVPSSADNVQRWQIAIAGDKLTITTDFLATEYRVTLDPGKKPGSINLYSIEGGKHLPGIYRLEKDRLTICCTLDATLKRPTHFISSSKAWTDLLVLERERK